MTATGPNPRRCFRGFTLIELLVVLTIIVILLSLAAGGLIMAITGGQQKQTRVTLHALASLASEYRAHTGNTVNPTNTPVPGNTYNVNWNSLSKGTCYWPQPWPPANNPGAAGASVSWGPPSWGGTGSYSRAQVVFWSYYSNPNGDNRTYESLQDGNIGHPPSDPAWWKFTTASESDIQHFCYQVWQVTEMRPQLVGLGKALQAPAGQYSSGYGLAAAFDGWGMPIDYRVDPTTGQPYFVSAGPNLSFEFDANGNPAGDDLDSRQIK